MLILQHDSPCPLYLFFLYPNIQTECVIIAVLSRYWNLFSSLSYLEDIHSEDLISGNLRWGWTWPSYTGYPHLRSADKLSYHPAFYNNRLLKLNIYLEKRNYLFSLAFVMFVDSSMKTVFWSPSFSKVSIPKLTYRVFLLGFPSNVFSSKLWLLFSLL